MFKDLCISLEELCINLSEYDSGASSKWYMLILIRETSSCDTHLEVSLISNLIVVYSSRNW